MKEKILICDDDRNIADQIGQALELNEYIVIKAYKGHDAIRLLEKQHIPILILDLNLPDIQGLEVLKKIKPRENEMDVIVLSGHGDTKNIVEAMKLGAEDFINKPSSPQELLERIRGIQEQRARRSLSDLVRNEQKTHGDVKILGETYLFKKMLEDARKYAESNVTVLIRGETGTGKKLVAGYIQKCSKRAEQPFINVHCPSLSEDSMISDLFGTENETSDGGIAVNKGRLELVHGGTAFFDEIGVLSPKMQDILARLIEDGSFERRHGKKTLFSDVRVLASSNRNIEKMTEAHEFSTGLYHRINTCVLFLPPLRERMDDIPLLARHFVEVFNRKHGKSIEGIENTAMIRLKTHDWPGNVRELESLIERAVIVKEEGMIAMDDLPILRRNQEKLVPIMDGRDYGENIGEYKKELIAAAVEKCRGNKSKMAKMLNISRPYVYRLLEKYNLQFFKRKRRGEKTEQQ